MRESLTGRNVLEVACGTGYWTERLAPVAATIVATDASEEMLDIARSKHLPPSVSFVEADAYNLAALPGVFDGALANFWFSHVPRARVADFLTGLHTRLGHAASLFMADNSFQQGVGGELVQTEGSADTFKRRYLSDNSEHLILKNYYTRDELASLFKPHARDLRIHIGDCYWWLSYRVASPAR
jgi:2-polyprenyl-3-methyl-5-hydroxy-6-metoxy-1,4-benzoquinol methylase